MPAPSDLQPVHLIAYAIGIIGPLVGAWLLYRLTGRVPGADESNTVQVPTPGDTPNPTFDVSNTADQAKAFRVMAESLATVMAENAAHEERITHMERDRTALVSLLIDLRKKVAAKLVPPWPWQEWPDDVAHLFPPEKDVE